jgi:hypothetical protein
MGMIRASSNWTGETHVETSVLVDPHSSCPDLGCDTHDLTCARNEVSVTGFIRAASTLTTHRGLSSEQRRLDHCPEEAHCQRMGKIMILVSGAGSLDSIVGDLDSVLLILELDNRGYRSEDFLLRDLVLVIHAREDGRLNEVSLVSVSCASQLELRFLLADLDIVHHLVELNLGNKTSIKRLGVLPYLDLLDHTLEFGNKLIVNRFVDDDTGTDNACSIKSP